MNELERIATVCADLFFGTWDSEVFAVEYAKLEKEIADYNEKHGTRYFQCAGDLCDMDEEDRMEAELAKAWDAHENGKFDRWTLEQELGDVEWVHDVVITIDENSGFAL